MRRVQRDSTKEEFIQELCDSKTGYFSEIWRLLLFAALLGWAKGKREPLASVDSGKNIDEKVFSNSPLWPGIIHLFALIQDKEPSCLKECNWETSLQYFEEYANGGLSFLEKHLDSSLGLIEDFLQVFNLHSEAATAQDINEIRL